MFTYECNIRLSNIVLPAEGWIQQEGRQAPSCRELGNVLFFYIEDEKDFFSGS